MQVEFTMQYLKVNRCGPRYAVLWFEYTFECCTSTLITDDFDQIILYSLYTVWGWSFMEIRNRWWYQFDVWILRKDAANTNRTSHGISVAEYNKLAILLYSKDTIHAFIFSSWIRLNLHCTLQFLWYGMECCVNANPNHIAKLPLTAKSSV